AGRAADADLAGVEPFFHDRGPASRITVSPFADPGVLLWLGHHGYRPDEFETVLILPLDGPVETPAPSEIEVRPAGPDEAETYLNVVAPGFCNDGPVPPEIVDLFGDAYVPDGL